MLLTERGRGAYARIYSFNYQARRRSRANRKDFTERGNYSSRTQTGGKQQGLDVKRQEMERVRDEGVKEQASAEERETPGSFPHLK